MAKQGRGEETEVIIVGAGPSGLATAACLGHLSIPYTLLERENCMASLWRKYSYDRVHLHLPKQFCELPLMPIPEKYDTYLSRNEFIQYLDDYASRFGVAPVLGQRVEMAEYDEAAGRWNVTARDCGEVKEYSCRFLVVASGETCDAFIPKVDGLESFDGEVLHSTQYKNGEKFKNRSVLVVGSGNSGMEISLDLADYGAKTSIVVRSSVHVLSRFMASVGLSLLKHLRVKWVDCLMNVMSHFVFGRDLSKYGINYGRPKEGPFTMKDKYGKYPVLDVGTLNKLKSGEIQVLPKINYIEGRRIVFENGAEGFFDAIVFATGFKRCTKDWLKGDKYLINENGLARPSYPNHWKGENGLYCCGLARKGLIGAKMDAQNVARDIKLQI